MEAEYVGPSPIGPDTPGTVKRFIQITFVADGTDAVLAWGGHVASVLDWAPAGPTRVFGNRLRFLARIPRCRSI